MTVVKKLEIGQISTDKQEQYYMSAYVFVKYVSATYFKIKQNQTLCIRIVKVWGFQTIKWIENKKSYKMNSLTSYQKITNIIES